MFVVSSRDLVLMHHVAKITHPTLCPNGGVLILVFTPDPPRDDIVPITSKAVRAHCHVSVILVLTFIVLDGRMGLGASKPHFDAVHTRPQHRLKRWSSNLRHQQSP